MARPLRILYEGAFYHVTSRGNDRHPIVRDDEDREAFKAVLAESLERYGVVLHAYCLMGNHFHLLVETPEANLPEFLRRLKITYAGAFNRRHRRTGHVFQGPYKAVNVDRDSSLAAVSRYIHLNPARTAASRKLRPAERLAALKAYPWSSLPDYLGLRADGIPPVSQTTVLGPYGVDPARTRERYWRDLADDLAVGRDIPAEAVAGTVIGPPSFVAEMNRRSRDLDGRERPAVRWLHAAVHADRVIAAVGQISGLGREDLLAARGSPRHLLMDALVRHARMKNREISDLLGLAESTISLSLKRLRSSMTDRTEIREKMEAIDRCLAECNE